MPKNTPGMTMKAADTYPAFVEWSDEDELYVGRCPDLFLGGCHGDNPVEVYAELRAIVEEEVADLLGGGRPLPPVITQAVETNQILPCVTS